jgi:hypothetical protein
MLVFIIPENKELVVLQKQLSSKYPNLETRSFHIDKFNAEFVCFYYRCLCRTNTYLYPECYNTETKTYSTRCCDCNYKITYNTLKNNKRIHKHFRDNTLIFENTNNDEFTLLCAETEFDNVEIMKQLPPTTSVHIKEYVEGLI